MTPPIGCTVASVLSPLQSSCRVGSSSLKEIDLAVLGGLMAKTKVQNIMRTTKKSHSQGGEGQLKYEDWFMWVFLRRTKYMCRCHTGCEVNASNIFDQAKTVKLRVHKVHWKATVRFPA